MATTTKTPTTSRRALLTMAAASAASLALPLSVAKCGEVKAATVASDPKWSALVATYREAAADWLEQVDAGEVADTAFQQALRALPEPSKPGSGLPSDFDHMTIAEIKAHSDRHAHKLAWAHYERDHTAWQASRDALSERLRGPAKRAYRAALEAESAAFDALIAYPATSPDILCEKIGIIIEYRDGEYMDAERLFAVIADVRRLAREA